MSKDKHLIDSSLPVQIAEILLHRIFTGEFKQGQRLIEADIASELQVSHAPVREAFYILQKDNILERLPRRGVSIRTIDNHELNNYVEILALLLTKAIRDSEKKWNANLHDEFVHRVQKTEELCKEKNILEYVVSTEKLLVLFLEVANNVASIRFFNQIAMITKVAAQTKWTIEKIENYQQLLKDFYQAIYELDFTSAIEAMENAISTAFK
ncbi:GntR family transcriptional regulator [Peribacillus frigoritolerans]|jgi:DNA-binding GntR family transcriptional regulator|uniref:GntR family transcriptional regulator n=1 Tax=Peribacillus frigoritolerans TaxID=450367 RepID=UPI0022812908|nr:GntR family transcriptional regulator [Peribacillus frigoritolerans]MCY9002389.1 GntR family transcriptional regulator [Peribacillus frigoritolerans]MED4632277.1 GntR family transcriptional regulator [Peribacillus frigoritolerans]